jgi:hypothetical protein
MPTENDAGVSVSAKETGGALRNRRPMRLLAYLAVALWFLVLFVGVAYGASIVALGNGYCEPFEGGSTYGELRWSVWPPGPTCTFTAEVHGFDEVRGPYPVMSIWLAALVAGGVLCVSLLRRSRSPRLSQG